MVVSDAETFLSETEDRFDIVACVSMLHHIPDYLAMLTRTQQVMRPGGSLLIYQEPLRYDRMARSVHVADRLFYFLWRLGRGELRRGLRTRWRRLRHRYDPAEAVDFEEYHVVRNGVDSAAILAALRPRFERVTELRYWANQSRLGQLVGDRLGLENTFGVLATGART
jgi:SAM-dependent methyltransferase